MQLLVSFLHKECRGLSCNLAYTIYNHHDHEMAGYFYNHRRSQMIIRDLRYVVSNDFGTRFQVNDMRKPDDTRRRVLSN